MGIGAFLVWGCAEGPDPAGDPPEVRTFDTAPVAKRSVPLLGGGIAASAEWVAASDVDGDNVRMQHLASDEVVNIALPSGWAPTHLAWTAGIARPRLHVVLRGTGSVAVIDGGDDPLLVDVRPVCEAPRGIAWDLGRERTWIACGGGELVGIDADGAVVRTLYLEPDLRDVVMVGDGRAMVARTKAAEVLVVDLDTGLVTGRHTPPARSRPDERGNRIPRVLRRLVPDGGGGAVALYQLHDDGPIETDPVDPQPAPADFDGPEYGSELNCGSVVIPAVATVTADGGFETETWLDETFSGYLADVTVGHDGELRFATAMGPEAVEEVATAFLLNGQDRVVCGLLVPSQVSGAVGSGITTAGSRLWGVTREPFGLWQQAGETVTITLTDMLPHTPLQAFHSAPNGISCASCHFDGDEDGHTWQFVPDGARRTQPLGGLQISETAPFHWDASLATFDTLFSVVGVGRMGLAPIDDEALLAWMDGLARPPRVPADPVLAARGADLFADPTVGCLACHGGWRASNGESADVGTGGDLQVPSLIGVGTRGALMHDGCAADLYQRFDDAACGGGDLHGVTSHLTSGDIDALVAYLQTL